MKPWHFAFAALILAAGWAFLECGASAPGPSAGKSAPRFEASDATPAAPTQVADPVAQPERSAAGSADPEEAELWLTGVVVDTAGNPLPGAAMSAWLQTDRLIPGLSEIYRSIEREAARTVSAADGRFRLRLQSNLLYDLLALKDGFARTRLPNLYAGEEQRVVMAAAAEISGRVTDAADGAPLAGVEVMASQGTVQIPGSDFFYATSDENGEYRFARLPPNFYAFRFDRAGYARVYGPRFTLHEGEQARADRALERGATLRGRVTDAETGLPIAGAEIGLRVGSHPARADAEGAYVLSGVPVGYSDSVFIRAEGYGKYDFPLQDVPAAGLVQDFGLLRGRTARGRVVDVEGQPVSGTDVVAAAHAARYSSWQMDRRVTRSDAEGRFTLTDLRVDLRHSLLLHADGLAVAVYDFPAEEWSALELDLGDLTLEPSCTLAGVVVDTNGRPEPELWVILDGEPFRRDALRPASAPGEGYMDRSGLGFDRFSARTDARGRFAIVALPTGSYFLSAGRKGFARRADLEVDLLYEGERATDLRLVLDAGLSISGVVVDRGGEPVPAASVSVAPSADPHSDITSNLAGPDGSFRLSGLEAGSYVLKADAGFSGRQLAPVASVPVAAGASDVRLVLHPAVRIAGTVLDADDRPVHNAHVQVWDEANTGLHMAANADRDGRFELWVPEGGPLTLMATPMIWIQADGSASDDRQVFVRGVRPGTEDLVILLP